MLEYNEFYLNLIRHGQSETNAQPDLMGQTATSALTEKGRQQAELLGKRLAKENVNMDLIYSSSYTRALDTATIATNQVLDNKKTKIQIYSNIREYNAGGWTGASRTGTITAPVKLRMAAMTNGFLPPNGESMHMVERRASQWLEDTILYNEDIRSHASERKKNGGEPLNIFVFSHGMTQRCLLHYIMGFDSSFIWKLTLDNTSISKLHFGPEGWRLLTINDHAHLL